MIHSIKCLHGRCLRLIYNDQTSSYKEVLEKDGSFSIDLKKHSDTC